MARIFGVGSGVMSEVGATQAWRHIVGVFRPQTADNVTWIWTISKSSTTWGSRRYWWPGARYVTWIGIDGYSQLPAHASTATFTRVQSINGDPAPLFGSTR